MISDGALCVFPAGFTGRDGAPLPLMLRKSDGGYGYDTTDAAAIRYRLTELHAQRLIYVVGSEQSQHLQMIFELAREAGWLTDGASAEHAVIGLVTGADGKRLKTRTGEQVKLATLIDEAVERAGRVIADRYDDAAQRDQIAEAVGVGALKYGDLSVARDSSYIFDYDRMLALTGNTGPYLQYATARIRSIFRRAGLDPAGATAPIQITAGRGAGPRPAPARLRHGPAAGRRDRPAAPAGGLPVRGGQRVHHVLRAVPGAPGRAGCPGQPAGAVRAHPAGPADRAGPAGNPGARAHVAGSQGGGPRR